MPKQRIVIDTPDRDTSTKADTVKAPTKRRKPARTTKKK